MPERVISRGTLIRAEDLDPSDAELLLKSLLRFPDFRLSQNVYSAQTFIYLREKRIEHGKRVFF
jgi:hypothetical protein